MASLLCVKQPGGNVQIHKKDTVEQLVSDGAQIQREMMRHKRISNRGPHGYSMSASSYGRTSMDARRKISQFLKQQEWLNEKTVRDIQTHADVELGPTRKLFRRLLEGEECNVQDIHNYIRHQDLLDLRKKELLHKTWHERVYEPIRRKIMEAVEGHDWPEVERRKRELHKQYIEFVNHKGHAFLETLDPVEYYALSLHDHRPAPIGVEVKMLRDPLLSQGRERNEEDRTILRLVTGLSFTDSDLETIRRPRHPLVPLGRHGTDSIDWIGMPLGNIESTPRINSRKKMQGLQNVTNAAFYKWPEGERNPIVVEKELKLQRKRHFKVQPPFRYPPAEVTRNQNAAVIDTGLDSCEEPQACPEVST